MQAREIIERDHHISVHRIHVKLPYLSLLMLVRYLSPVLLVRGHYSSVCSFNYIYLPLHMSGNMPEPNKSETSQFSGC